MQEDSLPSAHCLKARPDLHRQARRGRLLLRRRRRQPAGGALGSDLARRCRSTAWQPSAAEVAKIKAPINASIGELDTRVTGAWPAFDAALTETGVPHEGHVYKGANHGFHNDTTPRYDEAAAKEAWERTLDWFNRYSAALTRDCEITAGEVP